MILHQREYQSFLFGKTLSPKATTARLRHSEREAIRPGVGEYLLEVYADINIGGYDDLDEGEPQASGHLIEILGG